MSFDVVGWPSFADEFIRTMYGDGDPLTALFIRTMYGDGDPLTALILRQAQRLEQDRAERMQRYMLGPSKCSECGLTGNHDNWCPHWAPYVADDP